MQNKQVGLAGYSTGGFKICGWVHMAIWFSHGEWSRQLIGGLIPNNEFNQFTQMLIYGRLMLR